MSNSNSEAKLSCLYLAKRAETTNEEVFTMKRRLMVMFMSLLSLVLAGGANLGWK